MPRAGVYSRRETRRPEASHRGCSSASARDFQVRRCRASMSVAAVACRGSEQRGEAAPRRLAVEVDAKHPRDELSVEHLPRRACSSASAPLAAPASAIIASAVVLRPATTGRPFCDAPLLGKRVEDLGDSAAQRHNPLGSVSGALRQATPAGKEKRRCRDCRRCHAAAREATRRRADRIHTLASSHRHHFVRISLPLAVMRSR